MTEDTSQDAELTPWQKIKALRPAEPQVVKRVDLPLVHNAKGVVVGVINRAHRRSAQGRFRGVAAGSPRAARLTPADQDGRAASIAANREARRVAQKAKHGKADSPSAVA